LAVSQSNGVRLVMIAPWYDCC